MKKLLKQSSSAGFTLIELLVVATIIILLTTIGIVSYRNAARNSRNAKRKADMETVRQALIMYRSENGKYPDLDPAITLPREKFTAVVGILKNENYLIEGEFIDPKESLGWPCVYRYQVEGGNNLGRCEEESDSNLSRIIVDLP